MAFKNEFSWSKSRMDKFNACKRAYYFHYYGSWGGGTDLPTLGLATCTS